MAATEKKFAWKEHRIDRGLIWICSCDGEVVGGVSFSYLPSNNGSAFAHNHGKGYASLIARIKDDVILSKRSLRAGSLNEADKLVRKLIREEKLRNQIELAHLSSHAEFDDSGSQNNFIVFSA